MPLTRGQYLYRVFAGMACLLAAVGFVRYAYAPLLPAMFHAKWLDPTSAAYIGAVNFGANLIAALACARLARAFTAGRVARWSLLLGVIATTGDALPLGTWWIALCRLLAGCTAAGIIILLPVIAVRGVAARHRSVIAGLLFTGAGLGVVIASLAIPVSIGSGPGGGWLVMGGGTLLCTLFAWPLLRPTPDASEQQKPAAVCSGNRAALIMLLLSYGLFAVCSVPHSIFLSAYLHHELGLPPPQAALAYISFGIGLTLGGPVLSSGLAKCVGLRRAAAASVLFGTAAVAIVLLTRDVTLVIVSGGLLGMAQMGMVPIGSLCCLELAGPSGHAVWWGRFTATYTLGVTAGTLMMGAMFGAGLSYIDGFWMAAGFNAVSVVLAVVVVGMRSGQRPASRVDWTHGGDPHDVDRHLAPSLGVACCVAWRRAIQPNGAERNGIG